MKNLILIAIAIFTLQTVTAQRPEWTKNKGEQHGSMSFMQDLSANQMATLQTKRMTFQLDLSKEQIAQVGLVNLSFAKIRKSKIEEFQNKKQQGKPSADKRYKMMSARLDNRIAYKKELATILSKAQIEKWMEASEKYGKGAHFMHNGANKYGRG
jgi:hypothetical protein